jgi:hypothetical protein
MSADYDLLDIPCSLIPTSFSFLKLTSSTPPTQPRNPPEPKKKNTQWPQADDLKKLHDRYSAIIERALNSAHNDDVKKWCNERIERTEENDDNDIRQWHEIFKVMSSFGSKDDRTVISLSDKGNTILSID